MFRADAEADETGGDSPQKRQIREQAHSERWFERFRLIQHPCSAGVNGIAAKIAPESPCFSRTKTYSRQTCQRRGWSEPE
jgi:hypothetical protein